MLSIGSEKKLPSTMDIMRGGLSALQCIRLSQISYDKTRRSSRIGRRSQVHLKALRALGNATIGGGRSPCLSSVLDIKVFSTIT